MARAIPKDVLRYFESVPLFAAVSRQGIRALIHASTEVPVSEGKVLVREGEGGRELYVILEGRARVSHGSRTLGTLGPGDHFGELAFLDHAPRSSTVTATSDMRLLVLGPRELDVIIATEPSLVRKMLEVMAKRIRSTQRSLSH